jgi:hypothetical protein
MLSAGGFVQAQETAKALAYENLPIDLIYSGPHWQCLETLRPIVANQKVRVEAGLRNWYDLDDVGHGREIPFIDTNHTQMPGPTNVTTLQSHFDFIDSSYESLITRPARGWRLEPPRALLLRCHYFLDKLIVDLDLTGRRHTVLICTTAPLVLALGRILDCPNLPVYMRYTPHYGHWLADTRRRLFDVATLDFCQPDHLVSWCSISRFDRSTGYRWHKRWVVVMNGERNHLSSPGLLWRMPKSRFQNRHAPNPVFSTGWFLLVATPAFFNDPGTHVKGWVKSFGRFLVKLYRAGLHHFRSNPYRLGPWFYGFLVLAAHSAILAWIAMAYETAQKWNQLDAGLRDECQNTESLQCKEAINDTRLEWRKHVFMILPMLTTFTFFYFPPLLRP